MIHLPTFSYLVLNLLDDAHDGPLQLADAWLQGYHATTWDN